LQEKADEVSLWTVGRKCPCSRAGSDLDKKWTKKETLKMIKTQIMINNKIIKTKTKIKKLK